MLVHARCCVCVFCVPTGAVVCAGKRVGFVYRMTCVPRARVYVGCTFRTPEQRMREHVRNPPPRMRTDVASLGLGAFTGKVLFVSADEDAVHAFESAAIAEEGQRPGGSYNVLPRQPDSDPRLNVLIDAVRRRRARQPGQQGRGSATRRAHSADASVDGGAARQKRRAIMAMKRSWRTLAVSCTVTRVPATPQVAAVPIIDLTIIPPSPRQGHVQGAEEAVIDLTGDHDSPAPSAPPSPHSSASDSSAASFVL